MNRRNALSDLATEQMDSPSGHAGYASVAEALRAINSADATVADAVRTALPQIESAIEATIARMKGGGRLIYFGAGTSGRLGVLDAAECAPTFNAGDRVLAVIAGGVRAVTVAVEGAEDDEAQAKKDVADLGVSAADVVMGIAASGMTPYVLSAVTEARRRSALTLGLACNTHVPLSSLVDIAIEVETGPEFLAGSTQMKAATAQKMVLNMVSTLTMVGLGRTYGNLMVDMVVTNKKLADRAVRIVAAATGASPDAASAALDQADRDIKVAIVMLTGACDATTARGILRAAEGNVEHAVSLLR
jgi:N-acetylmuramic acid 6-phosphate etherase